MDKSYPTFSLNLMKADTVLVNYRVFAGTVQCRCGLLYDTIHEVHGRRRSLEDKIQQVERELIPCLNGSMCSWIQMLCHDYTRSGNLWGDQPLGLGGVLLCHQ